MSAVLQRLADVADIDTMAVWQAAPGAYLIIGRTSSRLPRAGSARALSIPGGLGVFRAESWSLSQESGFGFAIVVRLQSFGTRPYLGDVALRGSRSADRDFRVQMGQLASEDFVGAQLAKLAQDKAADVTRFLLDTIDPTDAGDRRPSESLLHSYLTHAAQPDGCIELLLSVSEKRLVLQGWGMPLAGPVDVLSTRGGKLTHRAELCEFARDDVQSPSTGTALILDATALTALEQAKTAFILSAGRLVARRIVQSRVLTGSESIGQLRHLYPRLTCSASLQEELRTLLLPRYERQETLSATNKPIRAAIDIAVYAPGAGLYVAGWIFDPAHHIAKIEICNGERAARLDGDLVWIERDDVVRAFAGDARFPKPRSADCGFSVSSNFDIDDGADTYLRFTLLDGGLAFQPVTAAKLATSGVLEALLESVDIHKRSGSLVVERALAPFIQRSVRHREPETGETDFVASAANAMVVPLFDALLPRSFISSLMREGLNDGETLVFLCGPSWTDRGQARLVDHLTLYGIEAQLLSVAQTGRPLQALRDALDRIRAEKFLVVSPNVAGLTSLARAALYDELDRNDVACPTVLYEDNSIRYAGSSNVESLSHAPFVKITTGFAGLPPSDQILAVHTGMTGGSLACCALRADAMAALGDEWPQLTRSMAEAAFFSRVERLALRTTWKAAIRVVAPDEAESDPEIRALIDGWIVRDALEADRCAC